MRQNCTVTMDPGLGSFVKKIGETTGRSRERAAIRHPTRPTPMHETGGGRTKGDGGYNGEGAGRGEGEGGRVRASGRGRSGAASRKGPGRQPRVSGRGRNGSGQITGRQSGKSGRTNGPRSVNPLQLHLEDVVATKRNVIQPFNNQPFYSRGLGAREGFYSFLPSATK